MSGRDLVVCCDGTWCAADAPHPTNVLRTARAARASATAWYDPGVGSGRWDRLRGGALGFGLARNIEEALLWISGQYESGDRLFLFGFSRGAYTARSLAGVIGMCGVPATTGNARVAMALYRRRRRPEQGDRVRLRRLQARSWPARVDFLGVWDTVGSLGVPVTSLNWIGARRHRFHDVSLGEHVVCACHALAIDEHRRHFLPAIWSSGRGVQVWFPGAHGDVGGGVPDRGLSDGALLWMWARAHGAGLRLDPRAVLDLAPDCEAPGREMSWLYRPFGRVERLIGASTPRTGLRGALVMGGERVHWMAEQRLRQGIRWTGAERVRRALDAGVRCTGTATENRLLEWAATAA